MPHVRLSTPEVEVPVANVFLLGKNYLPDPEARLAQRRQPLVVCMKPTSSILVEPGEIALPDFSEEVHYELELVLLIGEGGHRIPEQRALAHVAGYGVGLDLTALDLQQQAHAAGMPWMRSKSFASGAPVSEFVTADRIPQPDALSFSLRVNGELRQSGCVSDMVYSLPEIVSGLSHICPLTRGDVIFTGTPTGAGQLRSGDRLELDCMGIVQASFSVV